jgi:hypothetical protein
MGAGEGQGTTINVPVPGGAGHASVELLLREVVVPAVRRFRPDIILVSAGRPQAAFPSHTVLDDIVTAGNVRLSAASPHQLLVGAAHSRAAMLEVCPDWLTAWVCWLTAWV